MYLICRFVYRLSVAWAAFAVQVKAGSGYDSGAYPTELVERLDLNRDYNGSSYPVGRWLRIRHLIYAPLRGMTAPGSLLARQQQEDVPVVREALSRLSEAGYRDVALFRWESAWSSGVRMGGGGGGNGAPLDLRDAYIRARVLAEAYGDLVDAWEFENEPDIGFFADNGDVLAAYYKAVALGLAHGREQGAGSGEQGARSLIVMPAMCLPPGPYLEQLVRNGLMSYTEGVNLHFYGFAEDYGAAHDRLREALAGEWRTEDGGRKTAGGRTREMRAEGGGWWADAGNWNTEDGRRMTANGEGNRIAISGFRLGKLGPSSAIRLPSSSPTPSRRLPVFATEWGYPRLDGVDAQTVDGRVRQWRFFRDVQQENRRRAVAAPMAFYLAPYFEAGAKEFGLPMPPSERRGAHYGFEVELEAAEDGGRWAADGGRTKPRGEDGRSEGLAPKRSGAGDRAGRPLGGGGSKTEDVQSSVSFKAGGLIFAPEDFGDEKVSPWMRRIGEKIGDWEASPALAWLMEDGAGRVEQGAGSPPSGARKAGHFRSPAAGHQPPAWFGDWTMRAEAPSPVVIDFVAGEGTMAVKNYNGYLLSGQSADAEARSGAGKLVLYNFGSVPAEVNLAWAESSESGLRPGGAAEPSLRVTLAPGERREVAVELRVPGERFTAYRIDLVAEVMCGTVRTRSRWSSLLYPMPDKHRAEAGRLFFFPAQAAKENRRWLGERPHATEEVRLSDGDGRWRTTPGVTVEETATGWRIHVDALPGAYLSPAVAELPLPDDWAPWEPGLVLSYDYRIAPASFALRKPLRPDAADATQRLQTGKLGDMIESYLRTRTGAVYSTVPRLTPTPVWQRYNQPSETLTPHFPGRLAAPLKVAKERPAALVFYLRPMALPTVFEIERPALAHWVVTEGGR